MRQVYREVATPALGLDAPLGQQIHALRGERGFTLAELARRARTSAPTPHRYENGWDRFELQTLHGGPKVVGLKERIRGPGE